MTTYLGVSGGACRRRANIASQGRLLHREPNHLEVDKTPLWFKTEGTFAKPRLTLSLTKGIASTLSLSC